MKRRKRSLQESADCNCHICGISQGIQMHHMLHGSMRANADKYGLVVPLCYQCHMLLHDTGFFDKELQREAQRIFERDHTREEFIKTFGKSYL